MIHTYTCIPGQYFLVEKKSGGYSNGRTGLSCTSRAALALGWGIEKA
jgi:hypothetical protein